MRSLPAFPGFPACLRSLLAVVALVTLAACGSNPKEQDETAGWSANRLYAAAKEAQGEGSWETAVKMLEKLEARYPYGRFAQQAQLELAYVYWKSNEPGSALAAADRFIKLHPNHPAVDYALYLKGLVNFNEDLGLVGHLSNQDLTERDPKAAREAFESFKELVNRFPNSKYAPDSIKRMNYLVNALASLEVHVARYYMKRGAYIAAANRAQVAVETYAQAPAIEEAMYILVLAYDKLGMTELRDDADRVFKKNFPNSRFLTDGLERKTPWWQLW
ncbi:Beta-barrel assembly machine subunit BamD [Azonexus fungiphilus]|uniref:Outer membrane protein assembly factor BamD n=1 Tax=Azonexus fungiphilus TaxID=146940 RepID=A0A495WM01_9RHOO|nr:outer membrane protein assembly factor BamD [Azonexus fungiphilus]RKT60898.1 Beta-barrel assembly machine subunit BamD [Azonexus fungiphilus]